MGPSDPDGLPTVPELPNTAWEDLGHFPPAAALTPAAPRDRLTRALTRRVGLPIWALLALATAFLGTGIGLTWWLKPPPATQIGRIEDFLPRATTTTEASAESGRRGLTSPGSGGENPALSATRPTLQSPLGGEGQECDASYPDLCIPPGPPDLDCGEIEGRRFRVVPPDSHGFDSDGDGVGCET